MRILAIDVGSSSVKAAAWDGTAFGARARVVFRSRFNGVQAEAPAERVLAALRVAIDEAMRGQAAVDAVSFCTFSSGVVVTDAWGKLRAGAITHQDRRSVVEARTLTKRLGGRWLLQHTGNLPYPGGIGSSTLAWLRTHAREIFTGDYRVGQLSSLIAQQLTGEWVIDPSQAAFLGLWDIGKRAWSQPICAAVGVAEASLPRVLFADEVLGRVTPAPARRFGLREGTPVVGGFVDSSAAVIQTPMRPGQLSHNAGSTDVLAMCVAKARPAEGILTRPVGTGRVFGEGWLAVRTIAAGGSAVEWARRVMFSELSETRWRMILAKSCAAAPEAKIVLAETASCDPLFAGERASIEQCPGATFNGVTLGTGREAMLRAIVRGLVAESAESYRRLSAIHAAAKTVYTAGGAGALRDAMHLAWPKRHLFRELAGDSLHGLAELARRVLEGKAYCGAGRGRR